MFKNIVSKAKNRAKIENKFWNFGALVVAAYLIGVVLLLALNNLHAKAAKTAKILELSSEKVFETFKIDQSVSFYCGEDDYLIFI